MRYFPRLRTNRFFVLALIVMSIIGALYQLLFSPWGNSLLSKKIEQTLSSTLSTPVRLEEFALTHNHFLLRLYDDSGNTLTTEGEYSLLTLNFSAHYRLDAPHEGGVNPLSMPMNTAGAVSGGIGEVTLRGSGEVFGGNILYRIQLHRFKLASLRLKLDDLAYEPILHLLDYPSDTDTALSGRIDLYGLNTRQVEGTIRLTSVTDRFAPTPIKPDDNEPFDLKTLLADEFGRIRAFDVNITLDASLAHVGILEQFIGVPLEGAANLNATLSGDKKFLRLDARTDVAHSDTSITIDIPDLEPESIKLDLKHADLAETFALFALPAPITGKADSSGEFTATGGKMTLRITNGSTVPDVLFREYQITQPPLRFNAAITANMNKKGVHYQGSFKSDLNRLEIDNTTTHDQMLRELLNTLR
jgi:hypothetical protein